jgi:hypothetical protein
MSTPHCQSLRWVIYNGANTINNMWIILGAWLSYHMMFLTTTTNVTNITRETKTSDRSTSDTPQENKKYN